MQLRTWKFSCVFVFLLVCLCVGCSPDVVEEEVIPNVFKSESFFVESSIEIPRRSEGDILLLNETDLLVVYTKFIGGYEDHSQAVLVKRISTDKGNTWSEEVQFIEAEGMLNVMSASLLRLNDGSIALFYLVKNNYKDCFPVVRFSSDNGDSWSAPVACIKPGTGYHTMNNSRAIQVASGRIIIPISFHALKGDTYSENGVIFCCYSDDNGKTWIKGDAVSSPSQKVIMQEPGIVELLDGRILMYIRTNQGCQYMSYSGNNGKSWSGVVGSSLESPLSPASIVRNPYTKLLIAVWNKSTDERTPLCMATSRDEGKTWGNKVILEQKKGYWACYPAIEFTSATDVFVLYSISKKEQWGLGSLKLAHARYR